MKKIILNSLGPNTKYYCQTNGRECTDGDVLEVTDSEANLIISLKYGVPFQAELETKTKKLVQSSVQKRKKIIQKAEDLKKEVSK